MSHANMDPPSPRKPTNSQKRQKAYTQLCHTADKSPYGIVARQSPGSEGSQPEAVRGALQSFCRKLVWHRECLWPQDLPQHCLLVLEAKDDLVPSKLARTMLHKMKHPCDVRSPMDPMHASEAISAQ